MRSNNYPLNTRASSATLSLRQQQLSVAGAFANDASIAQELLRRQKIPIRKASLRAVFPSSPNNPGIATGLNADGPSEHEGELKLRRGLCSSNTWTSSSGGVSEADDTDDRIHFVEEFNRLAEKHGVRTFVPSEYEIVAYPENAPDKGSSWISRKIFRKTSSPPTIRSKKDRHLRSKRSISESLRLKARKDSLKERDLVELVRLCGSSLLYLPAEYAASSLALPTCLRATAQYLIQHAPATRGVFRIPGSQNNIHTLYNHYCDINDQAGLVAGTVRCPTLPDHIHCDVHDVASAFKKFLWGIPGGILGSLPLFDALVSIQTHLRADPELTRTKHSKVRARLIALSIATLRSTYRRELICAVFGLLCMVGRAAEITRREDERGRPLPTSDLMGYRPLGIVFGPLLCGDLLENYNLRLAEPHGSIVLTPVSPPKTKKEKHKKTRSMEEGVTFNTTVDKVKVANSITEMLITHWRDVVRHMKNLDALNTIDGSKSLAVRGRKPPTLRPSMSEAFSLRKPPDWSHQRSTRHSDRSQTPTPPQRGRDEVEDQVLYDPPLDLIQVRKQRSRQQPPTPGNTLCPALVEEHPDENRSYQDNNLTFPQTPTHKQAPRNRPYVSTKKEKDHEPLPVSGSPSAEPRVKRLVRKLETGTAEPMRLSGTDASEVGSHEIPDMHAISHSQEKRPKESRLTKAAPSHSATPKLEHASSLSRAEKSSSRDHYNHIRFELTPTVEKLTGPANKLATPQRKRSTIPTSSYHSNATDPLSRVSQEEDLASLALLARALDSPAKSVDSRDTSAKPERSEPAKHDSGVGLYNRKDANKAQEQQDSEHTLLSLHSPPSTQPPKKSQQAIQPQINAPLSKPAHQSHSSRKDSIPRDRANSELDQKDKSDSVAPVAMTNQTSDRLSRQNSHPSPFSKVASIKERFRHRKSPDHSLTSHNENDDYQNNGGIQRHHTISRATFAPKKLSVRALADKFNANPSTPPLSKPSPTPPSLSPAKPFHPASKPHHEQQPKDNTDMKPQSKDNTLISPYTINPSPSPTRSIASVRSTNSIRSFRAAALASRYEKTQAQAQQSPTKAPAPKRVLKEFVPHSTPSPRASGEERPVNQTSVSVALGNPSKLGEEPTVNQSSGSISLGDPSKTGQGAGLDGAFSSFGSDDTFLPLNGEYDAAKGFLERLQRNSSRDTPSRGNSVLYVQQIRDLKRQVYEKMEEVVELQKRVETSSSETACGETEIGELSELLKEAREEAEKWKERAVGAERKLEVLAVMSGERRGLDRWKIPGVHAEEEMQRGYSEDAGIRRMQSAYVEGGRDGGRNGNRDRRRLDGLTGSESSVGSSGTVVKEGGADGGCGGGYSYGHGNGHERERGRGRPSGTIEGGQRHNDWARQTLGLMRSVSVSVRGAWDVEGGEERERSGGGDGDGER